MFSLRGGRTVELAETFVQRCTLLLEIRGQCGASDATPLQLEEPVLRILLAADNAPSVASVLVEHGVITDITDTSSSVNSNLLAACVDAANFLGHAELHATLCACIAADLSSLEPLSPAAVRARYSLPHDLSTETARSVEAALEECTVLPPESLGGDLSGPGLAGLGLDSMLLIFLNLRRRSAARAATLACAAWAYAGLVDSVELLSVRLFSWSQARLLLTLARSVAGPSCETSTATQVWLAAARCLMGSGVPLQRGMRAWGWLAPPQQLRATGLRCLTNAWLRLLTVRR